MRVLTPSGYKDPADIAVNDAVCAFDLETGAPIINWVEVVERVDYVEWMRWWEIEAETPEFAWYRINGQPDLLFREQSIWRNGTNVCHARDLVPGDILHDAADNDTIIISIEKVVDPTLVWYRFDISGDHSYIVDGITVHNASRFWVGGTGTWDSSTQTHWGTSTGAGNPASVPGSADTVTLDGASGGGTVTVNFGGTITIQSMTMGAFTGTFDNSVNNNNITVTNASGGTLNWTGSGTRTYKLGTATYTISGSGASFSTATTTGLTYTGNTGATIAFTGVGTSQRAFTGGSVSHGTVTINSITGAGNFLFNGSNNIQALSITAPNFVMIQFGTTLTITAAFTITGTQTGPIYISTSSLGTICTIAAAAGSTALWCAFRDVTVTGNAVVAKNSFDLGNNTLLPITPPSSAHFAGGFFS